MDLAEKRAAVTGGTKGIGEAIVRRLRDGGARVVTTARTAPITTVHENLFVEADVATADGAAIVATRALELLGGVDILINVVGGSSAAGGCFAALTGVDWLEAILANLFASVRLDCASCARDGCLECIAACAHGTNRRRRGRLYESSVLEGLR